VRTQNQVCTEAYDRANANADTMFQRAPQALVADRWHILKNLSAMPSSVFSFAAK
jgi:hypothetical protein